MKLLLVQLSFRLRLKQLTRVENTKNIYITEFQIHGQAIRDDWCEVEPIYCCFLFATNSQASNLPQILSRHRSTAELRVVGNQTTRTKSLVEEPFPESNKLAMSRLPIRKIIISSFVGLSATSLNVCTRNSQTCIW